MACRGSERCLQWVVAPPLFLESWYVCATARNPGGPQPAGCVRAARVWHSGGHVVRSTAMPAGDALPRVLQPQDWRQGWGTRESASSGGSPARGKAILGPMLAKSGQLRLIQGPRRATALAGDETCSTGGDSSGRSRGYTTCCLQPSFEVGDVRYVWLLPAWTKPRERICSLVNIFVLMLTQVGARPNSSAPFPEMRKRRSSSIGNPQPTSATVFGPFVVQTPRRSESEKPGH